MTTRENSYSQYLIIAITNLLQLHNLELSGDDESPEGEQCRDLMDQHWYDMTNDERALLSCLSASLNQDFLDMTSFVSPTEKDFKAVYDQLSFNNYAGALFLLSGLEKQKKFDFVRFNCLKAHCWMVLGFPEVAVVLFTKVIKSRNLSLYYSLMFIDACKRAHQFSIAKSYCHAFDEQTPPLLWMAYASLILQESIDVSRKGIESQAQYMQTIEVAKTAIRLENEHKSLGYAFPIDDNILMHYRLDNLWALAYSQFQIGNYTESMVFIEFMLKLDTSLTNPLLLKYRIIEKSNYIDTSVPFIPIAENFPPYNRFGSSYSFPIATPELFSVN